MLILVLVVNNCVRLVNQMKDGLEDYYASELLHQDKLSVEYLSRDDHVPKKTKKHSRDGIFLTLWNLTNDILTSGTIGTAYIVAKAGLGLSIALISILAVVTIFTLMLIYDLSREHKKKTLPDLCELAFGRIGYFSTCFFIFTFNFGGFLGQNLMLADLLPPVVQELTGIDNFWTGRTAFLIFFSIFVIPLSLREKMASFAITSMCSVLCMMIIGFLCLYRVLIDRSGIPITEEPHILARSDFYAALGSISYTFVCHDLSFGVIGQLRNNNRKRYASVVYITVIITVIVLFMLGISGYLLFHDRNLETANMLLLYPHSDWIGIACKVFFLTNLVLAVPFSCIMPRMALTCVATYTFPSIKTNKRMYNIFFYTSTILILLIACVLAILITDMGVVFEIAGGISACAIGFILPPLLGIRLIQGWPYNKIICVAVVLMGVSIWICSITNIIIRSI